MFQFGGGTSNSTNTTAILKPEELWNIDTKMDDGIANYGSVVARRYGCSTATASTTASVNYDLAKSTVECVAIFRNLF